ncbi:MAG: hypothetical protein ACE5OT_03820 [Candidatus Hadarchaeaceae archaeon]
MHWSHNPVNVKLAKGKKIERKRTEEKLKLRVKELEEFHELAMGLELKMKQMEAEFERLKVSSGEIKIENGENWDWR